MSKEEKTIQQRYQKKTPLQHILIRPDTYVGSIQMEKSSKWVLSENKLNFQYQQVTFVPALYKIFDQVLVNAADNYQRDRKMDMLKVNISQSEGSICVWNNGQGIPVQIHRQHNMYVAQLIFGHLLTGSNYDDDEKRTVGGRNGYGAKLANIFSKKFIVQCGDGKNKKKFYMEWRNNMTSSNSPTIQNYSGKDYTSVQFFPDFKRFKMSKFDKDIIKILHKRVYDMAGLFSKVKVFLNNQEIKVRGFHDYVEMYLSSPGDENPPKKIYDKSINSQRWQVVVAFSEGELRQVSFVNSICTTKGGTHVNYILDQIVEQVQQKIKKKHKDLTVKPHQIKSKLWIFLNSSIQNPSFDSQTKQALTTKVANFGSTCLLSQKIIKQIMNSGVVDIIVKQANSKQLSKLSKSLKGKSGKVSGIPKLQDANQAGTRHAQKCTLILTQGDSAKGLAMAGIDVVGRDYYGVFPLKGKLLNVRDATTKSLLANDQIQNLMKILGLQLQKQYTQLKSLRYGSIMIMTDQDTDGSHIKGLIINFIQFFWPSLFKLRGYLKQFITPLLKATKGNQVKSFYTMQEFKTWSQTIPNLSTWKIKYYKGLGTSTDKEAQQYFDQIHRNRIQFFYQNQQDDQSIDLIFNKKKANQRKNWLENYNPNNIVVYNQPRLRYKDFVHKQFIHFSYADNNRSIASIIDGLKPGQRKILFACFKRKLKQQIKVAQLAGYVAQHSAYHHGQMSLTQTIIGMAQNFVGSNNINLLMPNGQYGSRNQGGKQHASARYIFTCLNKVTRTIFIEDDDHSLNYIQDDGQLVEPQYYVPIIPMVLVNGNQGIGTGWSTSIPNYNPRQLAKAIIDKLDGKQFQLLKPWYKGYTGQIVVKSDSNLQSRGLLQKDEDSCTVHILQLPIQKWTNDYKQFLEKMMQDNEDCIQNLKQHHTKNRVHFEITFNQQYFKKNQQKLFQILKLSRSISLNNLVGFNNRNLIQRYNNMRQILQQFYNIRISYYQKRKIYQISKITRDLQILKMKARFIKQVVQQKFIIRNVKRKILCVNLLKAGYKKFSEFTKIISTLKGNTQEKPNNQEEQNEENEQQFPVKPKEYDYLLSMNLWSLTLQKVQELLKQVEIKEKQLKILQNTTVSQMWKSDLVAFLKVLDQVQAIQQQQRVKGQKNLKGRNKQRKKRKKMIKKDDSSDGSMSEKPAKSKKKNKQEKQSQQLKQISQNNNYQKKKQKNNKKSEKSQKQQQNKNNQDYQKIKQRAKTQKAKTQKASSQNKKQTKNLISSTIDKYLKSDNKVFENNKANTPISSQSVIIKPNDKKKSVQDNFLIDQENDQGEIQYERVYKKKKRIQLDDSFSPPERSDQSN